MRVTYDGRARAIYVYVQEGVAVARTERLDDRSLIDYGAGGQVVGVEILDADEPTIEDITGRRAQPQEPRP